MPYAPGIAYRGDQYIAQGNQAAYGAAGEALQGILSQYEKTKQADKVAKAMYDFLTPEPGQDGSQSANPLGSKDQWNLLSAQDRISRTQAFVQAQAIKRAMSEAQEQSDSRQANLAALRQSAANQAAMKRLVQQAGTENVSVPSFSMPNMPGVSMPAMNVPRSVPPNAERLLRALPQNPDAVNSPQFDNVLRAMQSGPPSIQNFNGKSLLMAPGGERVLADVTPTPPAPQMPPGMEPLRVEQDESGAFKIHYGFPKAEGKALTQTEVNSISALNQAESDLNTLEGMYKELGPDYGGPVSGRIKSMAMGGQNPNIRALENAITAATPNLARGVFREVGVLTDQDITRYKELLPAPTDTQEVRNRKIKQLRDRIETGKKQMVSSLKAAGRDVSGFAPRGAAIAADAAARFDSEAAARGAGAKTGDVIELYDPQTATYRKARLK